MNKLKRALSLILCAAMLISLLPTIVLAVNKDNGTCTIAGDTVYVLVEEKTVNFTVPTINETQGHPDRGKTFQVQVPDLEDGEKYIIVAKVANNDYRAIWNNNGMNNTRVQVKEASGSIPRQYIDDRNNATVWTAVKVDNAGNAHDATREENDWRFRDGSNYINGASIGRDSSFQMSVRKHYLSWHYARTFLTWNNGWSSSSASRNYGDPPNGATEVFFYKETQIQKTYALDAQETNQIAPGETLTMSDITMQILCNGDVTDAPEGGTYSFEIVNADNAVQLSNGNLVAQDTGLATVRVIYSWTDNGVNNQVWDEITVEVTGDPFYTVDIKENGNSVNVLSVKGVTNQTTRKLTADVLKYGRLPVKDATVSWTSNNTAVVSVDSNGMLTFTGEEGTATIFAVYEADGKEYVDQIRVTASTGIYIIPADGTNDFPEYPNEGSIRFDKTAVAIGNFNDTGIAQVELSMTGVPFTTNNILDVVLLIDKSSSMTDVRVNATREATKVFVYNLVYNEDGSFTGNRIYVGCYLGGTKDPQWSSQAVHQFQMQDVTNNESDGYQIITTDAEYEALTDKIESTIVRQSNSYGTEYAQSLLHGYNLLNASKDDGNKQFCVFMTDGIPNVYQGERTLLDSSNEMAAMFTGNNYETRDTDYQYERYTTQMKANGVTVFTVGLGLNNTNSALSGATATQCLNVASMLLNDMSGPAGETAQDRDTGSTISKQDEYFFSVADSNAAAQMADVFDSIAKKIQEAAKDVQVRDVMGDYYTMVFEPPNEVVKKDLPEGQEFYIEILDYSLNPVTQNGQIVDYVRDTATSKLKLYMGSRTVNGKIHYYAASDAKGTEYAQPVFEAKPLGSMYYWTTADITASATYNGVFVEQNGVTYYFDTQGKMVEEGEAAPAGWYNMTSGAYANGTVTEDTHNTVENKEDDTSYCNDLIIATPYFVYNAATKTLNWTLDKIGLSETVITYFLYLDDSGGYHGSIDQEAGTYPTNEGADLTYTNFQDNRVQQEFPIPQMTWHGAQMNYVFYLVNEQGQPVNRAGRVVPFSEAVYVTDVYTKSVTWSGDDTQDVFQADQLASAIVPDVYTLFDTTAYYNIHVYANEEEMKKDNHFEIGGDKDKPNTTYVFNTKADAEKYNKLGVYAKKGLEYNQAKCSFCDGGYKVVNGGYPRTGFDYYDTVVAFAVLWIPALSPDAVVVDYGLDVVVDVTQNDLAIASPVGLMATPPKDGSGNDVAINSGQFSNPNTVDKLELKIGDKIIATAKMEGNRIRITLDRNNAMHFTNALLFYYVSEVNFYDDHKVLQTVYMYTSVRVIPATTIYYEEDYVRFDADWSLEGTRNASATQAVDRPGPNRVGAGYDADNVYGFDGAYAGCTEYSQNAAMMCQVTALTSTENVQKKSGPTATFSFTGTGFDIIGRTDTKTTSIIVRVDDQDEIFVDTYFEGADGVTAIKQVPVVTVRDLPYGTHNVTVEVVINNDEGSDFAHGETGKFYLDAVRIYEPADHPDYSHDNPVAVAYRLDKEFSPRWEEFGNAVLQRYGAYKAFEYAMFIDGKGKVTVITDYDTWGPNNELYLAAGQAVRLVGDQTFLSNLKKMQGIDGMADMQLGIKLASGSAASVTVSNGTSTKTITLNSATDLNFSLRDFYSKTITITNNGSGLVALTNLKVTVMPAVATVIDTSDDQSGGKNEDPVIVVPQQRPTEPAEPIPEAPNTLIAQGILMIKQAIAAVIIAVANIMDAVSSGLQRIAEALFAGGG